MEPVKSVSKLTIERTRLGLTQLEVCELADVCHRTILKLERGDIEKTRVETLRKVAKALDTTISDLFFSDDNKSSIEIQRKEN